MKKVTIVGLGYVGLPLLCLTAEKGYEVCGVDIDEHKIQLIRQRELTYGDSIVSNYYQSAKELFQLSTKAEDVIPDSDIIVICVQTPVDKDFDPDFTPLINASESITPSLRKNQLIIIESTIYPGTTEEIVLPILEKTGLIRGKDFYIGHCPERIDPGNKKWTLRNIPRICGAVSPKGLDLTVEFYQSIIDATILPLSSLKSAEACKVVENSFRDINIAFVNELAMSFDKMGIDITEVINGAASKPFAFLPHFPGAGVGGHCIPVDPYYLIKKAADLGFDHEFLRLARKINNFMPSYTVSLLKDLVMTSGSSLEGQVVGLLGISFKKEIDDTRNSPYFVIKEKLEELGVQVLSFDPYVKNMSSVASIEELLAKSDFPLLITNHKEFTTISPQKMAKNKIIGVVDGRNILPKEEIKRLGILYQGIGRN